MPSVTICFKANKLLYYSNMMDSVDKMLESAINTLESVTKMLESATNTPESVTNARVSDQC